MKRKFDEHKDVMPESVNGVVAIVDAIKRCRTQALFDKLIELQRSIASAGTLTKPKEDEQEYDDQDDDDDSEEEEEEEQDSGADADDEALTDHEDRQSDMSDKGCCGEMGDHGNDVADSAEALGFAVCAYETFAFLTAEGFTPDSPLIVKLRERLVGGDNDSQTG